MAVDGNDLIRDMMAETYEAADKYGITPDSLMKELSDELAFLEPIFTKKGTKKVKTFKAMRIRQEARKAGQQVLGIAGSIEHKVEPFSITVIAAPIKKCKKPKTKDGEHRK